MCVSDFIELVLVKCTEYISTKVAHIEGNLLIRLGDSSKVTINFVWLDSSFCDAVPISVTFYVYNLGFNNNIRILRFYRFYPPLALDLICWIEVANNHNFLQWSQQHCSTVMA